jgi:hypothetical protein
MKIEQTCWNSSAGWIPDLLKNLSNKAQLVLLFGSTTLLRNKEQLETIRSRFNTAQIIGCSTAGEILDTKVTDETLVLTAITFDHTIVKGNIVRMGDVENSFRAGEQLAQSLDKENLVHVFVLSDGQVVNGSDLVRGLTQHLPSHISVTGGLAGDGDRFQETFIIWNSECESGSVAVLGFYGDRIKVGYGSLGGWDSFGPERLVTKSKGNILYNLDGKSVLQLYKTYLGDHASGLPATGLLFPLSLRTNENETGVVRTILGIDEETQSLTFAGDIPEGSYVRFMKANFDRLIDGASGAARTSYQAIGSVEPDLAILISCVGRKMVLKQRIEEEVEGVRDVFGKRTSLTGFYSYGEISPFTPNAKCELHNQTMTITTFSEV